MLRQLFLAGRKVGGLPLVLLFEYYDLLLQIKDLDLLLVLRMLLLNGGCLALVDLNVESGDFVAQVSDLFLQGLVVRFQSLRFAVCTLQLRVLQSHLLVQLIELPLELPLGVFEGGNGGVGILILSIGLETSLDLRLDLKALLFKVSDLLNKRRILLSEGKVLV